jgi:hypothetical protein
MTSVLAWDFGLRRRISQQAHQLVVPYGPGGPADLLARNLAESASKDFGVPIVVVNKAFCFLATGAGLCRERITAVLVRVHIIKFKMRPPALEYEAGYALSRRSS